VRVPTNILVMRDSNESLFGAAGYLIGDVGSGWPARPLRLPPWYRGEAL